LPLCSFQGTAGAPADAGLPRGSHEARERPGERDRPARVSPPNRPRSHVGPRASALPQSRTARHPRRKPPTTNPFRGVARKARECGCTRLSRPLVSGLLPAREGPRELNSRPPRRHGPEPWRH